MSNSNQRVRYFDGEYLRSVDFEDEQLYHLQRRRRLNRALHLYGIVEGLQVSADSQSGITQVAILAGMAIDALGREIVLAAPYTLGDADISDARITADGTFDVWIRYRKTATTLPSAGYGNCSDPNQYTRWVESASVVLMPTGSKPFTDPVFLDEDTDDPAEDQVGVMLGSVSVSLSSITNQFDKPSPNGRVYIGTRSQRIRPPVDATPDAAPFALLNPNTALTPPLSLGIEANVYAQQNLVVGDDFKVIPGNIKPPVVVTYPAPTGNVKVTKDLFVNGNVYWNVAGAGNWLAFSEYVKQFLPDIVVGYQPVVVAKKASGTPGFISDTTTITLPSKLASISSAIPLASISGIQFDGAANLSGTQVQVVINSVSCTTAPNAVTVSVNYTTGPVSTVFSPINNFKLAVIAVCFP